MKIRSATTCDIAAIYEIETRSFSLPWSLSSLRALLDEGLLVCETEKGIAGFLGYRIILDELEILDLAVAEDCRRKGVGGLLLQSLLEIGRASGVNRYFLEVRQSNQSAIRLYQKTGFVPVGARKGYYEDNGETAIIMSYNSD